MDQDPTLDYELRKLEVGQELDYYFPENSSMPFMISHFKKCSEHIIEHWIEARKEDMTMEVCHRVDICTNQ